MGGDGRGPLPPHCREDPLGTRAGAAPRPVRALGAEAGGAREVSPGDWNGGSFQLGIQGPLAAFRFVWQMGSQEILPHRTVLKLCGVFSEHLAVFSFYPLCLVGSKGPAQSRAPGGQQ